ncbi:MAG: riboflavin synthase [Candidatus Latescibacterota bacterium]
MFTGLIEEVGRVRRLQRRGLFQRLEIGAARVLEDLRPGDSVNIDGACQTVVDRDGTGFSVESVQETLRRTTLGELRLDQPVNLERALRPDSRLGGHLVLGHVDGVGRLTRRVQGDQAWEVAVEPPPELLRYIATKGSVAVDGISLTVVEAAERSFTVAVIPHTFGHTTLAGRRTGDRVNLEVDVVARYVERLLRGGAPPSAPLTFERLRDMGY